MKIAIVGTGAMGSVYAALLGRAGHEVWAIDKWQEHIDAIATSGMIVSGASGSFVVENLHVGLAPDDVGQCDMWVIATKAADVEEVAAKIAKQLEARIVIPSFYKDPGEFLKAAGKKGEEMDKFVFKQKDILADKGRVVILKTS